MIALVLLSIVIGGMWAMMRNLVKINDYSFRTAEATSLAAAKIEALQQAGYAGMASGEDAVSGYTRTWTVTPGPASNTKQISVVITWTGIDGATHSRSLVTLAGPP
jgi:hypothetical protein